MATFELAQVNVARARGEMSDPVMAGFAARLDDINALAERSPGFVWRLQTEDGDATAIRPYQDLRILINLSVWADLVRSALVGAGGASSAGDRGGRPPGSSRGARPHGPRLQLYRALRARRPARAAGDRRPRRRLSRHVSIAC